MLRNSTALALALGCAAILLLASCGGGSTTPTADDEPRFGATLDAENSILGEGARLELVPAAGTERTLRYRLRARGLVRAKALYGRVQYDPARYHFVDSELPAGAGAGDRLWLLKDRPELGCLEFGWVLPDFPRRRGREGSLELCELRFAPGPAPVSRGVSKAPGGPNNTFTLAGETNESNEPTLTWEDTNAGDGNNDGLVTINDLTPLGQSFQKSATESGQARKADYNRDGLVTINDITVIGAQWQVSLAGYIILSGPSEAELTELTRFARADMFPGTLGAADGVLTWSWTGAALEDDTYFQVQPYDAADAPGQASDNIVFLEAGEAQIIDIQSVNVPAGIPTDGSGNYVVLISEYSADDIRNVEDPYGGNAEDFAPDWLQLTATVTTDGDPPTLEVANGVLWYITEGSGRANVGDTVPGATTPLAERKGVLTFVNRGPVTVTAQIPGDFEKSASVSFVLLSIEEVQLELAGGGSGPANVSAGDVVEFDVTGVFDWDGLPNGNEVEQSLNGWCGWGAVSVPSDASFVLDTGAAALDTTGAAGAMISVTCEYPTTENVTIGDNTRKASNFVVVNVS